MKRIGYVGLLAMVLAVGLSACGSNVKLDSPPVEDRTPTSVGGGSSSGAAETAVVPLQTGNTNTSLAGPANTTKTIYFDYDSYVLKPEFQNVVAAHAQYLKANASRKLALEGHTDERGGREYNLALGQKRAEAVRRALVLLGVADAQLEAVSFGKEKPAMTGGSEEAMAKNRRAELSYR